MSEPDIPRPNYGQQRTCSYCGTRVAQKAQTCFFCGALLASAPRRRLRLPWADFVLFAVVGAVVLIWWLRAPEPPSTWQSALDEAVADSAAGTPALLAQLVAEEAAATPTPTWTATQRPTATHTPAPTDTPAATAAPSSAPVRYKVERGDSVAAIAQRFNSTIKDIIEANNLPADGRLSVGVELVIPVAGPSGGPGPTNTPAATATQNAGVIYTVRSGDTLSSIAERFSSRVEWIRAANNMKPEDLLAVGKALLVPGSAITPTPKLTPELIPTIAAPTVEPGLAAPALLAPVNGAIITGDNAVLLSWTSVAVLKTDEWYVVTLRSNESGDIIAAHWTRGTTWRLPNEYRGGASAGRDYSWRVQVRRGDRENPGPQISPASIERRFTWR